MSTISSSPLNRSTNQIEALQSNGSFQNNTSTYQKQQYICCWKGCDQRFNNAKDLIIHLREIHIKILNIESPLFHCQWGDCKSDESTSTENLLNHESQMDQGIAVQNISESVQQQPDSQLELQVNQHDQRIEESQKITCALQLDTVPPDSSRQVDSVKPKEIVIIDDDESAVDKPIQVANSVSAAQRVTNNRMSVMQEFDTRSRQITQTLHYSYLTETQGHSVPSFNVTSNQVQKPSRQFQVPSQMAQVPGHMAHVPSQMAQVPSHMPHVPSQMAQVPSQVVQFPNQRVQVPSQRVQMGANASPHNSFRYHPAQHGNNIVRTSQQNYHTSGLPLVQTYQDENVIRIIQQNDVLRQENEKLKFELRNMMTTAAFQEPLKKENEQLKIELQNLKAKIAAQEAQPRQSERENFLMVELRKLKTQLMLKESQLKMTEGELVYHRRVTNLITEQIRRSDSKMREIWVNMLLDKGRKKHNEKMLIERASLKRTREETDMQDSITGAIQKRSKESEGNSEGASENSKDTKGIDEDNTNQDVENMDVEPIEKPDSAEYDINVITEAYVCQWDGCKKAFRTKLALKAHIPSEHIAAECLRVHVDRPSIL
ncbi:5183_t:CDS:2 [Cetraspora pellucida]|uniref:5183_t:CDS:1 n=1 Tax=Cetraspora pellucida TaxID=1433469 RepID=A0A9N9CYA7_9GLOM|nr:5183_t:CDS:2 [Cetraspora pellucida]